MGNENETRERPANFQSSSFGDSTPPSKFLGATGTRDGLVIYLSVEMSARTETFPKKSNTTPSVRRGTEAIAKLQSRSNA